MAGRLINSVKHVGLLNDNAFKSKSLEDNVYFTLRDIFWNGSPDDCFSANHFNSLLTNGVSFEERGENFRYTNVLYDYNLDYTKKLYSQLSRITGYKNNNPKYNIISLKNGLFDFINSDEVIGTDVSENMSEYLNYDDWWNQLQELIGKLEEQLEKLNKWEAEDIQRDCDRVAELEYEC